jgi:hypothetical protein
LINNINDVSAFIHSGGDGAAADHAPNRFRGWYGTADAGAQRLGEG